MYNNKLIQFLPFLFFFLVFGLVFFLIIKQSITSSKNKKIIREKNFTKEMEEKYLRIIAKKDEYSLKIKRKVLLTIFIMIILAVSCLFLTKTIILIVPIFILGIIVCAFISKDYDKYFKENIISEIITEYNSNLKYYPFYGISKEEYKMCRFYEYFDDYYSEDLIINEQTGFQFADIILKKEETDSDGNTRDVVVYTGSVARLPIKDIKCNIYLGSTERSIFGKNTFTKLDFENDEFNKMYKALSDNELEAYKILTPDVMEKFVELKKNFFADLDIRLLNNCLYMRFLSGNGFEPSLMNTKREEDSIMTSLATLNEVINVMQKVKDIIESKNID